MKKQKFEVGDRIADLSYMVDRNDLKEHAKGTITYVPMDPIISGVLVLKDDNKKKGIMYECQVEYDDLIRLVKKKKPVEKRVAREYFVIETKDKNLYIFQDDLSALYFAREFHKDVKFQILKVREVLDEPSGR